jgi:hypothetical protein
MLEVLARIAPLIARRAANETLDRAIIGNAFTRTRETAVNLAQRCGVNRHTVAAHVAAIEFDQIGTRQVAGKFDHASARIETLLWSGEAPFVVRHIRWTGFAFAICPGCQVWPKYLTRI